MTQLSKSFKQIGLASALLGSTLAFSSGSNAASTILFNDPSLNACHLTPSCALPQGTMDAGEDLVTFTFGAAGGFGVFSGDEDYDSAEVSGDPEVLTWTFNSPQMLESLTFSHFFPIEFSTDFSTIYSEELMISLDGGAFTTHIAATDPAITVLDPSIGLIKLEFEDLPIVSTISLATAGLRDCANQSPTCQETHDGRWRGITFVDTPAAAALMSIAAIGLVRTRRQKQAAAA